MFDFHCGLKDDNSELGKPSVDTISFPVLQAQAQMNYEINIITSENSNESTKENSDIDFSKISQKGVFKKIINEINREIYINEFAKSKSKDTHAKNISFQILTKYLIEAVENKEIQHNELSTKSYWTLIKLTLLYMVMLFDNKRSIYN